MTDAELRTYLLGQSSEADAARVEERLLEDESVFGALQSLEDDLFDDYARGRLNSADREQFLARYASQGARLTFARALAQRTASGGAFAGRRQGMFRRHWMPLAAAATVVIATGALLIPQNARQQQAAETAATVSAPAATPVTATVRLTLGSSRAGGAEAAVPLPPDASALRLRVAINPADRFDSYAIELRSSADNIVWGATALRALVDGGETVVEGNAPAGAVADGRYEVGVYGVNANAPREPLGFVTMQVQRTK